MTTPGNDKPVASLLDFGPCPTCGARLDAHFGEGDGQPVPGESGLVCFYCLTAMHLRSGPFGMYLTPLKPEEYTQLLDFPVYQEMLKARTDGIDRPEVVARRIQGLPPQEEQ